jgi:pimeloyl-ACP methyl ester carboxylesterase
MQTTTEKYVKVGNINTRLRSAGEKGTNVILIHGLGGSIENWENNIEALAQRHRVYALDLKGFGRTDKTPLLRDLDELVQFIYDFMTVMHIEKASLIGNSLGGGLALFFALKYPDKVDKLVLADPAGMGREVIGLFKIISIPVVGELLSKSSRRSVRSLWKNIVYDPALVTDELVEQTYNLAAMDGANKALLATARAGINFRGQRENQRRRALENIGKLKAPTLIFWGKQDKIIPAAHAQAAIKMIPNSELHIFEKCGHMPQLECSDDFNRLVLEFLDK